MAHLSNSLLSNWNIYTHKIMLLPSLVREVSFCSGQQSLQRLNPGQSIETNNCLMSSYKWDMYNTPPNLREHQGTNERKNGNVEIRKQALQNVDFCAWFCILELSAALVICTRPSQDYTCQHSVLGGRRLKHYAFQNLKQVTIDIIYSSIVIDKFHIIL